jgi:hypothetical protein
VPPRSSKILVAATVVGFGIAAAGAQAVLTLPAWRTGAHAVVQHGPDGEVLRDVDCTEAIDIHARMIVHDGAAWTWCKGAAFPHGALSRIDAGAGTSSVRWPLPDTLPFGDATDGVFPGPDGSLGIVFRVDDVNGRLALGIAGADGWRQPPTALPGNAGSRLLGGAWVRSALEVVVVPTGDDAEEDLVEGVPVFVRVEAGSLSERRPFADADALCPGEEHCVGGAQVAHHRDGAWQLAVESSTSRGMWWVAEDGSATASDYPSDLTVMIREHVDFADAGLTRRSVLGQAPLRRDGSLGRAPQPPNDAWEADAAWHDFEVKDGRLHRRASFIAHAGVLHRGQQVGDRFLATNSTYEIDPPILAVTELAADGTETSIPVAHDPGYECGGSLAVGTFIARADGGFALVSDTGCYVLLDAALRRLDPLPLHEHLSRRGSLGRWHEQSHAVKLAWVLLGLPLCVGLGVSFGVLRRRRAATSLRTAAAIGACVYVVTGIVCLAMVLPLLT